jgi:hypothetical protein
MERAGISKLAAFSLASRQGLGLATPIGVTTRSVR